VESVSAYRDGKLPPLLAEVVPVSPLLVRRRGVPKILGISQTEVDRLIRAGELKAKKYGRSTLVLVESIERFVERLPDV
jgi:hypothetical protein